MHRPNVSCVLIAAALFASVGCTGKNHRPFETVATQEEIFTARADDPYAVWVGPSTWSRLRDDLQEAQTAYEAAPNDETAIIWVGRRQAYLGLYHEAIATYSRGLTSHPNSAQLRRHRGHRFITIRKFDRAIDDLTRATRLTADQPDEIEQDGAPNALGIPRSTLKTNISYHLALALYLTGEFEQSRDAWETCYAQSPNDDMRVAAAYWLYLTQMRLGDDLGAAETLAMIEPSMDVIENFDYHSLLLMFKGDVAPEALLDLEAGASVEQSTRAYGVAMYHYFEGDRADALDILEDIVEDANPAAFGSIAAEVDLGRL